MSQVIEVECFYRDVPLSVRHLRGRPGRDERYWIGSGRDAAAPAPIDHLLVETYRNEILIHAAEGMTGEVRGVKERLPLATWLEERGSTFALPEDAVVELRLGPMTFVVSRGEPAIAVGPPPRVWRWSEQKYLVGTALVLGLTLGAALFIPPDARALSFDRFGPDIRFIQTHITPPFVAPLPAARGGAGAAALAGRSAPGTVENPRTRPSRPRDSREARVAPPRSLVERVREIRELTWLGFRPPAGSPMALVLESAVDAGLTPQLFPRVVPLSGPAGPPAGYRVGGVGARGTGAGGAGFAEHSIGDGRIRTIGVGDMGALVGPGAGALARRHTRGPDVIVPAATTVRGNLDKEIIRRVIRRHINEVRFCYEKELARAPALAGRVAVNFTIAPTGRVAAATVQSSTLGSARAESCLVDAARRWEFPQPVGGGLVIATYPFSFVPAGQ